MNHRGHRARRNSDLRKQLSVMGVAARARNRIERAEQAIECGRITFDGPMFGGLHTMRLLAVSDGHALLTEVDGKPWAPKSIRGLRALIAKRILR